MRLNDQELDHLFFLVGQPQARKNVAKYLRTLKNDSGINSIRKKRIKQRISVLNKIYKGIWGVYYKALPASIKNDVVMEAYASAFVAIKRNSSLESAIERGTAEANRMVDKYRVKGEVVYYE